MKFIVNQQATQVKFWLLSVAVIIFFSIFGRHLQAIAFQYIQPLVIAASIVIILCVALMYLWIGRKKNHVSVPLLIGAFLLLGLGTAAVALRYLAPVEVVHFLVFSWLGWISSSVFGLIYGSVALIGVACGDELLQYYLPSRVGDLHDVVINLLSGGIGLLLRNRWQEN